MPEPSALPTAADILPKTPEETPPPGEEVTPELPEEILALPVMHGLLNGAPAAVSSPKANKSPEIDIVTRNKDVLVDSGFGFYSSNDGKLTVLYNGVYISPDQLKAADDAGKLAEVAVPFSQLKSDYDSAISGDANPGQPVAAPSAAGAPPSAGAQKRVTTARLKNLQPGSPTSGPSPGAGRILNSILSPTV